MNNKIMNGKDYSEKIKLELKNKISLLSKKPELVDIQIGNDEASNIYIARKKKAAESVGMIFHHIHFEDGTKEIEIINKIKELNSNNSISGILIQLPLPYSYSEKKLINYIDPNKDVDGLTELNLGKLFLNSECLTSCTPLGIMKLLKEYDVKILKKHVVIVGRSSLVGKPLIHLFLKEDATVTVCHSKTNNLKDYTKTADILVVATGQKHLITRDMVKNDSVIIDVGINRINGKIYGDVDFDGVVDLVSKITPVPGGVGPMTVVTLLSNVLKSYEKINK